MAKAPQNYKEMSDEQLIKSIADSDNAAFKELFNRYYKILLGTSINLLKAIDPAKDVVQDVFLQLWKNREKTNINSSVLNYLKRAVINTSLNQIQRNKRFEDEEVLLQFEGDEKDGEEILENEDLQKIMKLALLKVPEKSRIIFILKRQEGLSLKEISEKLEISPKTVENQITKALKILKESLAPYYQKYNNSS